MKLSYFIDTDGSKKLCMGINIINGSSTDPQLFAMDNTIFTAPSDYRFFNRVNTTSPDSISVYVNYKDLLWTANLIGDGFTVVLVGADNNLYCHRNAVVGSSSDTFIKAYKFDDGAETSISLDDVETLLAPQMWNSSIATASINWNTLPFRIVEDGFVYLVEVTYTISASPIGTDIFLGLIYWSGGTLQHEFSLISRNINNSGSFITSSPILIPGLFGVNYSMEANRTRVVVYGTWADSRIDATTYSGAASRNIVFETDGTFVNEPSTSFSFNGSGYIPFANNYGIVISTYYDDEFNAISTPALASGFLLSQWLDLGAGKSLLLGAASGVNRVRVDDGGTVDDYALKSGYGGLQFYTDKFGSQEVGVSDELHFIDIAHATDFAKAMLPVGSIHVRPAKFAVAEP